MKFFYHGIWLSMLIVYAYGKTSSLPFSSEGYGQIVNTYKTQLHLVRKLESHPDLHEIRAQYETTLITIARMLTEQQSPEATRMLRSAGIDITELLSWVAVID